MDGFIIVILFDSAGSAGYAYSLTSNKEEIDPLLRKWGREFGLETPKTPACILFDKQEHFSSFGYEAKRKYLYKNDGELREMFFFDCLHMALHGKNLTNNLHMKAANGKEMSSLKVFAEALRFLKNDALKTISHNTSGREFIASNFNWVVAVPAFWDLSAKHFIAEAATQAGIITDGNTDKLIITDESEAALSWCMKLPADGFIRTRKHDEIDQSPGTQLITVVAEEETTIFTVHEVLEGGGLKELHRSSDKNHGGQTVNMQFKEFLREIFSDGVWDEYERTYPSDVQKLIYDFSRLRQIDEDVLITCPFNLGKLAQRKQDLEKLFEEVEGAFWYEGSIGISRHKLRSFLDPSLQSITYTIRKILNKGFNICSILLVGEYAECKILRRHITDKFIDYCKVLCPFRPGEAALKGAVELGKHQRVMQFQKSAFTYGIGVSDRFDEINHKEKRKFTNKEGEWCGGLFIKLVEVDEYVDWNKTIEFIFYPIAADQTMMNFHFYRTIKKDPKYVTEKEVEPIGSLFLNSPNTESGRSREVKLTITFDRMEMKIKAKDLTSGSKTSTKFDFM